MSFNIGKIHYVFSIGKIHSVIINQFEAQRTKQNQKRYLSSLSLYDSALLQMSIVSKMSDLTITVEQVNSMNLNELCEILDREKVDYSSLDDKEDIRDLVLQYVTDRNSWTVTSHSQEQV